MRRHLRDAVAFLLPCALAALVLWAICEALRPPDPVDHGAACRDPACPARQAAQEAAWWDSRGWVDWTTAPARRSHHGPARAL